jgi:hypothetical protein
MHMPMQTADGEQGGVASEKSVSAKRPCLSSIDFID